MTLRSSWVLLGVVISVAGPSEAHAARWSRPIARIEAAESEEVARYLREHASELELQGVDLVETKAIAHGPTETFRFAQWHEGVRVFGAGVTVRILDRTVRDVVSDVDPALRVSVWPSLHADRAIGLLEELRGARMVGETTELVVVRDDDGGRLAWLIEVPDARGGASYLVDAHNGDLLRAQPLALDAKGRVYAVNHLATPIPTDVELDFIDVAAPQRLSGWGGLVRVTNFTNGDPQLGYPIEQTLGPNIGGDFLYSPPASPIDAGDPFSQVNLYVHLTRMRGYFSGFGLSMGDEEWRLTAVANAKDGVSPLNNAFYSPMLLVAGGFEAPNYISVGQGSLSDFATDSDIVKHEFGHYVSKNTGNSNLGSFHVDTFGLSPHSGSIDEGISDYFACSDNDDPVFGEASLGPLGGTRDLRDTSKRCPDDMNGEVHDDGEIIASFGWSLRSAYGQETGDALVWGALTMLPEGGNFGDFGRGVAATARDLVSQGKLANTELPAIEEAMKDRGIDGCDPELSLEGDTERSVMIGGAEPLARAMDLTCEEAIGLNMALPSMFHFHRKTRLEDSAVVWHFDMEFEGEGDGKLEVFVRKGDHVSFRVSQNTLLPWPEEFDARFMVSPSEPNLVLDANSSYLFEPGAKYFIAIVNKSCTRATVKVSASNDGPTGTPPWGVEGEGGRADGAETVEVISGFSCRVSAGGERGAALFVGGLALGWFGRRRRARQN